jgi:hypothetical protein
MYLDRVVLEHIRGFTKLDFKLARPEKSHAGSNGSAKLAFGSNSGSQNSSLLSPRIARLFAKLPIRMGFLFFLSRGVARFHVH